MAEENRKNNKATEDRKIRSIKESMLCFHHIYEGDDRVINAKKASVYNNYKGFLNYIKNAKDAATYKQSVSTKYTLIDRDTEVRLSKKIYIKILSRKRNGEILPYNQEGYNYFQNMLGEVLEEIEVKDIKYNNQSVTFIRIGDLYIVDGDEKGTILINDDKNIEYERERYYANDVIYKGHTYSNSKSLVNIPDFDGVNKECCDKEHNEIIFTIRKDDNKNSINEFSIQLEDASHNEMSVLDMFFEDSAGSIYLNDDKDNIATIRYKMREQGRIKIQFKDTKYVPPQNGEIHLNADTNQLVKQNQAIHTIINRPAKSQKPLLDLGFEYKYASLDNFDITPKKDKDFIIFGKDADYQGTKQQKEFVNKALSTPDFMILQGPPGSGKTTAILELIYQLCKSGKKVLLCASTHVAIDNVLEKIIDNKKQDQLLSVINPVRVGDEYNVYSESVKRFVYDNVMNNVSDPDYKKIVQESFNLVCGTIIGVLQFPLIKKVLEDNKQSCIEPLFDYLIIDEASKTTFSEFLVPGILCKRWIIVGDINQLAPYIDQEDLVPNLKACKTFSNDDNCEALGILEMYAHNNGANLINKAFIVNPGTITYISNHLKESQNEFVAVCNKRYPNLFTISEDELVNNDETLAALTSSGIILLIEKGLEDLVIPKLNPETYLFTKTNNILKLNSNKYLEQIFRNSYAKPEFASKYTNEYSFYSKKVEDEIIWRLIRLYELGENQKSYLSYSKYIDRISSLLNEQERKEFEECTDTLKNIAIPSIIKMLQTGVNNNSKRQTRLSNGLLPEELQSRFVRLEYQHRMHKDISRFSRENIYQGCALKDTDSWTSKLSYPGSEKRAEIRNIKFKDSLTNNVNPAEVDAIMNELTKYMEFVKENPATDNHKVQIAILSFYTGQVNELRKRLRQLFHSENLFNFSNNEVKVSLNTVDKFQGQEADIVYLSMVQKEKTGFLDSISRLNVALTRAKEKIIVFGDQEFFSTLKDGQADLLKKLFTKGGY